MVLTETESLSRQQKLQIVDIWNKEYPKKVAHSGIPDFDQYLDRLGDKHHILLSGEDGVVKGWLVYFTRDNERWFAMILDSSVQGQGWGSKLLDLAKKHNAELNGRVVDHNRELKQNGERYRSPVEFYKKNGFNIRSDTRVTFKGISGIKVTWTR